MDLETWSDQVFVLIVLLDEQHKVDLGTVWLRIFESYVMFYKMLKLKYLQTHCGHSWAILWDASLGHAPHFAWDKVLLE